MGLLKSLKCEDARMIYGNMESKKRSQDNITYYKET